MVPVYWATTINANFNNAFDSVAVKAPANGAFRDVRVALAA